MAQTTSISAKLKTPFDAWILQITCEEMKIVIKDDLLKNMLFRLIELNQIQHYSNYRSTICQNKIIRKQIKIFNWRVKLSWK
jgi:hypothetical protein